MTKPRRRPWTLSPRYLPDPSVVKNEPLLQDLENNAVFRMMVYRRESSILEKIGAAPLLAFHAAGTWGITFYLGVPWGLTLSLLMVLLATMWFNRAPGLMLGLEKPQLFDLVTTPCTPKDFALAIWGMETKLAWPSPRWFIPGLWAITLSPLLIYERAIYHWLFSPAVFFAGMEIARRKSLALAVLPNVIRDLTFTKDAMQSTLSRPVMRSTSNMGMLIHGPDVLMLLGLLLFGVIHFLGSLGLPGEDLALSVLAIPQPIAVLVFFAGMQLGRIMIRSLRNRQTKLLEEAIGIAREIQTGVLE